MSDTTTRVALVTGANRGIGREIARQLAESGMRVGVGAREREAGEGVAQELGDNAHAVHIDVTDPETIAAAVAELADRWSPVEVLVNNAGIMIDEASAHEADVDVVRQTLEVNTLGALACAREVLPPMLDGGWGRIVNMSSGMGQLSEMGSGTPGYRVSKTALNAVTRMLHAEVGDRGVKVNSMCPGWVATDMGGSSAPRSVAEGADTAMWLATLDDDGPAGGFFRNREPIDW
ncbi:MAG: SDR family NAD(P)-dependent oxidoreductase [Solirubrobacterales bacterium]